MRVPPAWLPQRGPLWLYSPHPVVLACAPALPRDLPSFVAALLRPVARFAPGVGGGPEFAAASANNHSKVGDSAEFAAATANNHSKVGDAAAEACSRYFNFVSTTPYSREALGHAATLGSVLLEAAHGWKEATQMLRDEGRRERGDHFAGLHETYLEPLLHPTLLEEARRTAKHGVEVRAHMQGGERVRASPHPSLKGHLDEAAEQIWHDAQKGRVLIVVDQGQDGLRGVVSAPLARVPKYNPDRTMSSKGRVIWDATAVNKVCAKEDHPPALQPRHSELARVLLWWASRYPALPILLSKKDVAEAFKWIPVSDDDVRLFAADLGGKDFGHPGSTIVLVYNVLTFGWWRGAPGQFMLFAWTIKSAFHSLKPTDPEWNDTTPFRSLVLMDDTIICEPDIGLRPHYAVTAVEELTRRVLGPEAINPAKDAEEGGLTSSKLIWGLLYDTEQGTRTLPSVKLEKASHLLRLAEFDPGNTKVPLRLLQELRGNQQFWMAAMPALAPLLSATNALLGPADSDGYARPKGPPVAQARAWQRFWEAVEVQRLLVEMKSEWSTVFTHPLVEALSLQEVLALPGQAKQAIWASGDATLETIGAVDWTNGSAFSIKIEELEGPLRAFVETSKEEDPREAEGESNPGEEDLIVAVTELLALVALASAQRDKWRGKVVIYAGDNQVVRSWVQKRTAPRAIAAYLLQLLSVLESVYGFRVYTAYIRTYHNRTADDLTRLDPRLVFQREGLRELENVSAYFQVLLDRGWHRRALIWSTEETHQQVALQLSRLRQSAPEGVPGGLAMALLDKVCVEWDCDYGAYSAAALALGAVVYASHSGRGHWRTPIDDWDGQPVDFLFGRVGPRTSGVAELAGGASRAQAKEVWADAPTEKEARDCAQRLEAFGYRTLVKCVAGRTLEDQIWWRRWIVCGAKDGDAREPPCHPADEEPQTPAKAYYDLAWLQPDKQVPADAWVACEVNLDSGMPHLGATAPRPAGHFKLDGKRALLWEPHRPLPSLHQHSCEEGRPDALYLLGTGQKGPGPRRLLPVEAQRLWGVKPERSTLANQDEAAQHAMLEPPVGLAKLAGLWAGGGAARLAPAATCDPGAADKVGVCTLPWEDEAERAMLGWVEQRQQERVVGGKGSARRSRSHRGPEGSASVGSDHGKGYKGKAGKQADWQWKRDLSGAVSRVLRHQGGTEASPMTEEGWMRLGVLVEHPRVAKLGAQEKDVRELVQRDNKQRYTLADYEGEVWVAAWSGHSIPFMVGPAWLLPDDDVPRLLVHGSYARHQTSIQQKGVKRHRRDVHLQDPRNHHRRWRADLEIKVTIDTQVAIVAGCTFRLTGNQVYLCDADIPAAAVVGIEPWDNLPGGDTSEGKVEGPGGPPRMGIWEVDGRNEGLKQEVVEVARTLAAAAQTAGEADVLAVDPLTLAHEVVKKEVAEARFAPVETDQGSEPDWDAEDDDEGPNPTTAVKQEESKEAAASLELGSTPERQGRQEAGEGTTPATAPAKCEEPKEEKIEAESSVPERRPKRLLLGTAKVLLLSLVAEADAQNWDRLQDRLRAVQGSGEEKAELVERLEELAEARSASRKGLLESAAQERQRLSALSEEQQEYLGRLTPAMRELERRNPVGPTTGTALITTNRLSADIAAGVPIWVARRAQRARERAARNQAQNPKATREAAGSGQRDPEVAADLLDEDLRLAAARDLREFRQELAEQGGPRSTRRQPESKARKKRRREAQKKKTQTAPATGGAMWAAVAAASAPLAEGHSNDKEGGGSSAFPLTLLLGLLVWGAAARFAPGLPRRAPKRICWCFLLGTLPPGAGQASEAAAPNGESVGSWDFWLLLALAAYGIFSLTAGLWSTLFGASKRRRNVRGPAQDASSHRKKSPPLESSVACTPHGEAYHLPTCRHVKGRPHRLLRPCGVCNPKVAAGRNDDAERDRNHAIAHPAVLLVGVLLIITVICWGCCTSYWRAWTAPSEGIGMWQTRARAPPDALVCDHGDLSDGTNQRVGVRVRPKKRVRFAASTTEIQEEVAARPRSPSAGSLKGGPVQVRVPFLGGPAKAREMNRNNGDLRLATLQGKDEWEAESLSVMLNRYAQTTQKAYQAQWVWWQLFCNRRGLSPWRNVRRYDAAEEQLLIEFALHTAVNGDRAPGTVKVRLAAVRSLHLTAGLPDPTAHTPRLGLVLAGLKRRYGTKERRRPVTPRMLSWLRAYLLQGSLAPPDAALLWGALALGWFFLLRASEYLDVGYTDQSKGLKGKDVILSSEGKPCKLHDLQTATEITLHIRGSKTDIYNRGETRHHFATGLELCPVQAARNIFACFPNRYQGGIEESEPLFRDDEGKPISREAINALLVKAARAVGEEPGDLKTHSLRFGGASALWAAYKDAAVVKRFGRWASDSFQTYRWDSKESSKGVATNMATADLTPA